MDTLRACGREVLLRALDSRAGVCLGWGMHHVAFRYFRASPLPHLTMICSLGLAVGLALLGGEFLVEGEVARSAGVEAWSLFWAVVAGFSALDGLARYRESRRLASMLSVYGFRPRILRVVSRSRCQRDAALCAAREAGCAHRARSYFRSLGYRWYHLLPDPVLDNPLNFFRPSFLSATFLPGRRG